MKASDYLGNPCRKMILDSRSGLRIEVLRALNEFLSDSNTYFPSEMSAFSPNEVRETRQQLDWTLLDRSIGGHEYGG
jgi:hypothetical protein